MLVAEFASSAAYSKHLRIGASAIVCFCLGKGTIYLDRMSRKLGLLYGTLHLFAELRADLLSLPP